jgi:DNA-binding SARP family transcriptional activator
MARVALTLLGGFEGRLHGSRPLLVSARKAWALLAYLALPPGRMHPRDTLTALLWGGVPEARARASLRQALFSLRRALGESAAVLVQESEQLGLDAQRLDVDAARLERALGPAGDDGLEAAIALYRGDLLSGLVIDEPAFEEWLVAERERLRELVLEGLARLLARQRAAGDLQAGVRTALRLLAIDPLQESVHRTLMRLHVTLGRRGDALRQYRECVAVLRRELDAEPELETRRLYQEVLRTTGLAPRDITPRGGEQLEAPTPSPAAGPSVADPPLLGREIELARLHAALAASRVGDGSLLVIHGEAGIGKSRLIAELVSAADREGVRVVVGHAYEGERELPFGLWVDAIRQTLATSTLAALSGLSPESRSELARLVPELDESRPSPPEGPGNHRRLFEAVVALVHRLAADRPLLFVLEDLHWADESSLRLLAFLSHRLHGHRVSCLLSVRDEDLVDAPDVESRLEEIAASPRLTLGPLTRSDTAALVGAIGRAGAGPADVAALTERVWAVSEGNPLLAVEATRAYGESRDVEVPAGGSLPDRIRGLVAGRLRRVSEPARAVLTVAALLARGAAFPLLQRAARLPEAEAAAAVEELVRRRLLREEGEGFALAHDRLREAIGRPLLAARRQMLHRRIADALEAIDSDTTQAPWAALAMHLREAREWARAQAALVRLGEQAALRYADEEAARAFVEALELMPHLPHDRRDRATVEVLVRLAPSLYRLGRFRETVERFEAHRAAVDRLDDPTLSAPYAFWLAHAFSHSGRTSEVFEWARRAVEAATRAGDRSIRGKAEFVMCDGYLVADRFQEAIEHARQAVKYLDGTPERWWLGQAWYLLAGVYHFAGRLTAALEAVRRAEAIGEALGDRRLQAYAAYVAGWTRAVRGDGAPAVEACHRGLALAPDPLATAGARYRLGVAYLEDGRPAEALPFLEAAVESFRGMSLWRTLISALTALAETCRELGQRARARSLAEEAARVAEEIDSTYRAAWVDRLMGRLERDDGHLTAAVLHLEASLRKFAEVQAQFEVGRTHLDLGSTVEAMGASADARVHFARAREIFEVSEAPVYMARAASRLEAIDTGGR